MISQASIELAKQARNEYMNDGQVKSVCPKCHEHPKVTVTPDGGRMTIKCPCGYIVDGEIYF